MEDKQPGFGVRSAYPVQQVINEAIAAGMQGGNEVFSLLHHFSMLSDRVLRLQRHGVYDVVCLRSIGRLPCLGPAYMLTYESPSNEAVVQSLIKNWGWRFDLREVTLSWI